MKFLALFTAVFVCGSGVCISQTGYRITYTHDPSDFPVTFNGTKREMAGPKDRLVFLDTLSFSFRLVNGSDPANKKNLYGTRMVHHGTIYNSKTGIIYSIVAWPPGKKNEYLIWDTLKNEYWIFLDKKKTILNYNCKAAVSVNEKNDTCLVWYTPDIPKPFGPFLYMGFPGAVLEVTDQRFRRHFVATKIEEGDFMVVMPSVSEIISMGEARERFKTTDSTLKGPLIYKTKREKRN